MSSTRSRRTEELVREHHPDRIAARLASLEAPSTLPDVILGAIDGCVTTIAIVAGAVGAGVGATIALILGVANVLADGFSMAVSNYQSTRAEAERIEHARKTEETHIALVPEGEREEIRQIFRNKGFDGAILESIVETITGNREVWIETMLADELGFQRHPPNPVRSALATYAAFVLVGLVPLLPLVLPDATTRVQLATSLSLAALIFFSIGLAKGRILGRPSLRSGIDTLLMGGAAAALAFVVSYGLRRIFGVE